MILAVKIDEETALNTSESSTFKFKYLQHSMFNLRALILKAAKDFLRFLLFISKYFSFPNLFLISLYVLNFDIFFIRFYSLLPKMFIPFLQYVLYTISMKQN